MTVIRRAAQESMLMGRYAAKNLKLTRVEIAHAFSGEWAHEFPPILNVAQAAKLAHVSHKTVYDWSQRGLLDGCAHRQGKRPRLFRDRFVGFLFESKE